MRWALIQSRTDSCVALSSCAEMLDPSSSELRRLIEYTMLEMLDALAMELWREPILRSPRWRCRLSTVSLEYSPFWWWWAVWLLLLLLDTE